MSLTSVADRVEQIRQMIDQVSAPVGGVPAGSPASSASFAAQLQQASAVAQAQAAASPVAPVAVGGASGSTGGAPPELASLIQQTAARYGIDPALLTALVRQESGFDPRATSGAGAMGLTQLMPGTARTLGVTDPYDPAQSLDGGARYLRQQLDRFGGNVSMALAAYNAGPGAVERFGGVPPYAETQHYVQSILAMARQGGFAG